jgi:hypothetical protein
MRKIEEQSNQIMTRRAALQRLAALAGAAALPALGLSASARAAEYGTTPKSAVHYQDHPKGHEACANCFYFIPGKSADTPGHCKLVAGSISPKGWCWAYAGD